ncbi:serine hydrolase domain-containing protein [Gymnodinialimonas sp. 2305UL16-5]|uniref:serine hydrolase domain-containing protein n=1 Tax=Gymnodinialimonas mytili TaxID=3126503 RepID=UPI0030B064D6
MFKRLNQLPLHLSQITRAARPFVLQLALICAATTAAAEPENGWRAELSGFVDGVVTSGLDRDAVAGAVVVVVSGDDVILSRGYRLADARTGRLMSPENDVIPLASISKVFTAWAILQLEDEGRLALDDPIAQHLPTLELNQRFGEITVAHLLSHTAGLEERYSGYFTSREATGADNAIDHISAVLPRQNRPPGEVIAYSNASYVLLGEIVAQVSGQPFVDYVADMLAPFDIEGLRAMHTPSEQNGANPFHVWDAGRYLAIDPTAFPAIHTPSGGLALTGEQMGRVMQVLLANSTADGAARRGIANMYAPAWPGRPEFGGRTQGFWTETWAGYEVFHHAGTHFGFHSNMVLVPDLGLGFFVTANGPSGSALTDLPRRVLNEVIAPDNRPATPRIACAASCLQDFEGRYLMTRRNETGLDRLQAINTHGFELTSSDDEALLIFGLGHDLLFEPIGDDRFETPDGVMRLGFRRDASGGVVNAYVNGGMHTFDRVGFWHSGLSLDTALWSAAAGIFVCLVGIAVRWRKRRTLTGASMFLGGVGLVCVAGCYWVLEPILRGRDLSAQAAPGLDLWSVTGLCIAMALALLWSVAHAIIPFSRMPIGERVAILVAGPLFAWFLIVAWVWNVPTAALTW